MVKRLEEWQKLATRDMKEDGMTNAEIGKVFGVSKISIAYHLDPNRWRKIHNEKMREWYKAHPGYNREKHQEWCKKNPERVVEYRQEWNRKHVVRLKSRRLISLTGEKRPYSETCELCARNGAKKPIYHHWDDSNPILGMWICQKCHRQVEAIETPPNSEFREKYFKLKSLITEGNK